MAARVYHILLKSIEFQSVGQWTQKLVMGSWRFSLIPQWLASSPCPDSKNHGQQSDGVPWHGLICSAAYLWNILSTGEKPRSMIS